MTLFLSHTRTPWVLSVSGRFRTLSVCLVFYKSSTGESLQEVEEPHTQLDGQETRPFGFLGL